MTNNSIAMNVCLIVMAVAGLAMAALLLLGMLYVTGVITVHGPVSPALTGIKAAYDKVHSSESVSVTPSSANP